MTAAHLIGSCTVTSLVPSGNVASTWMSWIISGMPSMHCARVITSAPDFISSATVRPSRAPSTMKSEMIATASGWLSLTPRSSLRRATIAAIEIRSLSFSRGERFMRALGPVSEKLIEPQPRQRWTRVTKHGDHVGAQHCRILCTEAGRCKAVPGGDADLAAEGRTGVADPRQRRLIPGHDQRGADRAAAIGDRAAVERRADVAVEPHGLRKGQPAAAAQAPAVGELAAPHGLAHRGAPEHHDLAQQQRGGLRQIDVDGPRDPRLVEQDGFLRQPGEMRA